MPIPQPRPTRVRKTCTQGRACWAPSHLLCAARNLTVLRVRLGGERTHRLLCWGMIAWLFPAERQPCQMEQQCRAVGSKRLVTATPRLSGLLMAHGGVQHARLGPALTAAAPVSRQGQT